MSNIDLKVTTRTIVNVRARRQLEDGTRIAARSMARGIRLTVQKPNQYHPSEITIPEEAFDALGEIFIAVREAREENGA
jgi:hypothetical protein